MEKELFRQDFTTSFLDADPAGIVFFSRSLELAHKCYERFVTEVLHFKWDLWFNNPLWALPIVHCSAQYTEPLYPGRAYTGVLMLKSKSGSSFTLLYHIFDGSTLCVEVSTTHTFIDKLEGKKRPIPKEVNDFFASFAAVSK